MCLFTGIHYFGTGPRSEIHLLNVNDVKRVFLLEKHQEFKMKNLTLYNYRIERRQDL